MLAAVSAYEKAKVAPTSAGSLASRLKWWADRAEVAGLKAYPSTVQRIQLAGALLKEGAYRSGPLYLSAMKREHVRLGGEWSMQLSQEIADGTRALDRGKGPDKQSGFIGVDALLREQA
jgi:hypothetical protein